MGITLFNIEKIVGERVNFLEKKLDSFLMKIGAQLFIADKQQLVMYQQWLYAIQNIFLQSVTVFTLFRIECWKKQCESEY